MRLTLKSTPMLQRFVGGQIEIQNPDERQCYRGQIRSISVEGTGNDTELVVELNWLAKREGSQWVEVTNRPYRISLLIYQVSRLREGRLHFGSDIMREKTILFPQKGRFRAVNRTQIIVP